MYQLETEDMLPRCAPKPSVPLDMNTAAIVRPTVPEVSILFGAQHADSANAKTTNSVTPDQPQQTYAAWKKQVLPKVSFPPVDAEVYSINGRVVSSNSVGSPTMTTAVSTGTTLSNTHIGSNLYPLRPVTANGAPMTTIPNTGSAGCLNDITQMQEYRRSIEQPLCSQENIQRRSLDTCTSMSQNCRRSLDVLTICAGTQTDATLISDSPRREHALLAHVVTKEDFQQLFAMFGEMRMEQLRLISVVESLLVQQQSHLIQTSITRQNASTQYYPADCCRSKEMEGPLTNQRYEASEEYNVAFPSNDSNARHKPYKEVPAFALESPRQPAAQSTAYQVPTLPTTAKAIPLKPNTEKSMLMNELAMKYLPNEQLNVLLKELNIAPSSQQKTATPLRTIENYEKRPSDMSSASYKYLKKYRLLPEGHDEGNEQLTPVRSPITQVPRHHQEEQSPYQQTGEPPRILTTRSPMLDLEHIRLQPKLI